MTTDPQDPRLDAPAAAPVPPPAPRAEGDLGPGLRRIVPISTGPLDMSKDPDRFDPTQSTVTGPLDMSKDPDRFDPVQQPVVVGPLDLSKDPDRMPVVSREPGEGQSLTDLLGKDRSYEEDRDGYEWIAGLLAVLAFLAVVAFLFNNVLTP